MDELPHLGKSLSAHEPSRVLIADRLYFEYNATLLQGAIDHIAEPSNAVLIFCSDRFRNSSEIPPNQTDLIQTDTDIPLWSKTLYEPMLDRFEKYFMFPYGSSVLPEDMLAHLRNIPKDAYPGLKVPPRNKFLPQTLEGVTSCTLGPHTDLLSIEHRRLIDMEAGFEVRLTEEAKACLEHERMEDLAVDAPELLVNKTGRKIWYKLTREFQVPSYSLKAKIYLPNIDTDAKSLMKLLLAVSVARTSLEHELFDALLVGYDYHIDVDSTGIELTFSGFRDRLSLLVETVSSRLGNLSEHLTEENFAFSKEKAISTLEAKTEQHLYKKVAAFLGKSLRKRAFLDEELLVAVRELTFNETAEFAKGIFERGGVKAICIGEVRDTEARGVVTTLLRGIGIGQGDLSSTGGEEVLKLQGRSVVYRNWNPNPDDLNHLALNYYQIGARNNTKLAAAQMLVGLMRQQSFLVLRTHKQLGYVVWTSLHQIDYVDGFFVLIEGSKLPPHLMDKEIESFLRGFEEYLTTSLTDTAFAALQQNAAALLDEKDKTLQAKQGRYWSRINLGDEKFNIREILKREVMKLHKEDLIDLYREVFKQNVGKLSIQIFSKKTVSELPKNVLTPEETYSGKESDLLLNLEDLSSLPRFPRTSDMISNPQ
eukprot:TRINITY_DN3162_c0_g1_i4.p1 TRINITY_DN3162_c0_g1~~TRINITY_DN3162_c0_g1_i4.p1  ORF type:complete len:650 (-),score=169.94 TRINITY_DN3162_c0_g1_i4:118-2067(-)